MWKKSGRKYTVSNDGSTTIFNLDGMVIKQGDMSQEEANQFLNMNGYSGFAVDEAPKASKSTAGKASKGTKINGKDSSDLRGELDI